MSLHALPGGYRLAEYRIERLLGEGGFGLTYLAVDTHLSKQVAIKEYLPSDWALRSADDNVVARSESVSADYREGLQAFIHESRTLARFDDRNIVRVHRYIEANGTAYLVMEYCAGGTLEDLLERQGRLDEEQVQRTLGPIMNGLQLVHEADVLHRDIKPHNIMFRDPDTPVLIDFGAARQITMSKSRSVGAIVSPPYAPLEQYSRRGNVGPWTDIYALAAVAYRCLTGHGLPDAPDRVEQDDYQPLVGRLGDSPFLRAIDRGLALKSVDRPRTLGEWYASWGRAGVNTGGGESTALTELDELLELAGLDKVITEQEMEMLLKHGERLGLPLHIVQQHIVVRAQQRGWNIKAGEEQPQAVRGDDLAYTAEISLEQAAIDSSLVISYSSQTQCSVCGGHGRSCSSCNGMGRVESARTLKVKVPAGVDDGDRIRISGEGDAGQNGGEPGDLYIIISVVEHPSYRREGQDIYMTAQLPETLARSGGELTVESLRGALKVHVPEGLASGTCMRLRGQGLPSPRGGNAGDLYITFECAESDAQTKLFDLKLALGAYYTVLWFGFVLLLLSLGSRSFQRGVEWVFRQLFGESFDAVQSFAQDWLLNGVLIALIVAGWLIVLLVPLRLCAVRHLNLWWWLGFAGHVLLMGGASVFMVIHMHRLAG